MPRVNHVKAARKDYPQFGIQKGDSYYWWSFRFGPEIKSKTYPKRWQLTQSAFLQELWQLEDGLEFDREDLDNSVSSLVDEIQALVDQCQDSLDNMPDNLRESSETGMLLQERIDALEQWISDLQSVDLDVPDIEDIEVTEEDLPEGWEGDKDEAILELKETRREEHIDEIIEELTGLGSGL